MVFLFCINFLFFPGINYYLMFYLIKFKKKNYTKPSYGCINIKPFIPSNSVGTVEFQYIYIYILSLESSVWLRSGPRGHACCTAVVGDFPASSSWDFPSPPSCVGSGFLKNLPSSSLVYLLFWSVHPPVVF